MAQSRPPRSTTSQATSAAGVVRVTLEVKTTVKPRVTSVRSARSWDTWRKCADPNLPSSRTLTSLRRNVAFLSPIEILSTRTYHLKKRQNLTIEDQVIILDTLTSCYNSNYNTIEGAAFTFTFAIKHCTVFHVFEIQLFMSNNSLHTYSYAG